ncbi:procollagen-lysine 5-dioxygenase [Aureococcus anophagefferens]|nr:procollagen-lysine 5-dioxygenase [Aureococcus anophagefferens]
MAPKEEGRQPAAAEEAKDAASPAEERPPKRRRGARRRRRRPPARSRGRRSSAAPPDGATLKVASVNAAGLRAVLDEAKGPEKRDALAALVASEAPDVLCLNEHKLKDEDVDEAKEKLARPRLLAGRVHLLGPAGEEGLQRRRHALQGRRRRARGRGGDAACLAPTPGGRRHRQPRGALLTLALPGTLSLVATYVPNSGQDLKRLAYRTEAGGWDRSLAAYVASLKAAGPVAVIGDLNCCHAAADMHNMHARPNFEELNSGDVAIEDQYAGLSAIKKQAGLTAEERVVHGSSTTLASASASTSRDATLEDGAAPALSTRSSSDADTPQLADTPVGATFVLE